ncbi:non-ribosomal peptide synthetase [Aquimarina sediminis]|uniref:non-ribosomal peptide synthetase n=1 Tax=Aquimarina sediminis TaxID=2070536 RepID=UPI000CA03FE5|nr:non-ribosomal peptide synthetase [Aquimarina sediminis]
MKLTLPQQDVYFEQLLYPKEPIYNIGAKIAIKGNINFKTLNDAYIKLIEQHDAYRSIVVYRDANAEIEILPEHKSSLDFIDFSYKDQADTLANDFMQNTFEEPFDFSTRKLLHKFILVKVNSTFHYLFSMYHHIITDGWGTSLMFQRLVQNYNELINYGEIKTQYPYSYTDFVVDDENYHSSDAFEKDKLYWTEKFKTLPERLFEKTTDTIHTNTSSRQELIIKRVVYNKLVNVAKESKSSTFHVILGILYLYFGRKHQNMDFAIGLPVLNRSKSVFKKTVGLFMGVSALRMSLDFENTFEDLVYNIKQQLRQDYRYQRFPLGKLVQELDAFKDKDRLFNITLSYEKQNYADHFENTKTKVIPLSHRSERVALAVYIREFDEQDDVKIDFDYNLSFFDENSIKQVVTHFEQLISEISIDHKKTLSDYQYITPAEEQLLLNTFNQTQYNYPKERTLLSFFTDQVKKNGDQIAVQDKNRSYSYQELDHKSNLVADYLLRNFGNKDQSPIAVLMHRSVDFIAVLVGIFKSGRAYVPLDPSFPIERLKYIINHSKVKCIIGDNDLQEVLKNKIKYVNADEVINHDNLNTLKTIKEKVFSDLAYIIYTSGSTGNPKGVAVGHQSLLNFLLSIQQKHNITSDTLLYSVTTQSFDISILEFFIPLISGATLYVVDKDTLIDPLSILKELENIKPNIIQGTPSFYQMLYNAGWSGDKELKVLCGGDLLSESLAENLLQTCAEVWNMYGPTETTIWSSSKQINKPKDASNIGEPIHNTKFYILDGSLRLVPQNTSGNIYIGGDGLAKGYYKNEKLTAEKFIKNPFVEGEKIYDTGDIGKWNNVGEIQFLGRNDHQVKIRGYRIELGEIETKLNQLSGIKSSVVIAKKGMNQEAYLVAYVVFNQKPISADRITNVLRKELPEYMIPYIIVPIEEFPLTPNKKIDRKSLILRDVNPLETKSNFKKPTTEIEIILCRLFKEVIELTNKISVTDNFFQLGGHSLNAVRLIGKIEKELGFHVSLRTVFEYPTVEMLSGFLEKMETQQLTVIPSTKIKPHYPLTLPQYAIWLASFQSEKSIAYNMFRSYKIEGKFDKILLEKVFRNIISKYEILKTNFVEYKGSPRQKIREGKEIIFEIEEFFVESSSLKKALETYANREFDLKNDTLLRLGLFKVPSGQSILLFVTHHIIMDGWSLEILIKEVVNNYRALVSQTNFEKKLLPLQFKDYAVWQHEIELENKSENRNFWKQYLDHYQWRSLITYDLENGELSEKYTGSFHRFNWDKVFLANMDSIALKQKITFHTLIVTAFYVLIYKTERLNDICIGTINSGRPFSDLHSQIGMFVKTLPLRLRISPEQSLINLLQKVQEDMLVIDKHQDIPEDILSQLRLEAIIVLQNPTFNYEKIKVKEDFVLDFHPVDAKYNRLPLLISFSINEEFLHGSIYYDTSKYEKETIELLVSKFKKILEEIIIDTNVLIEDIDIELAFEKEKSIEIDFSF